MSDSFLGSAFKLGACALVGGFVLSELLFSAARRDAEVVAYDRDLLLRTLDNAVQNKDLEGAKKSMNGLIDRHSRDKAAQIGVIVAFRNIVEQWPPGPYMTTLANDTATRAAGTNLGKGLQMIADKCCEYWPLPKPVREKPALTLVYSRS